MANNSRKPDALLQARINKAQSTFFAVRSNCKLLEISNIRVKLQLVNALVTSVLQYGCVVYACLSNVESALDHTNSVYSKAEIFFPRMLRWALNIEMNKRNSFLYVISNQVTVQVLAQKAVFRFFKSLSDHPRFISKFVEKIGQGIEYEFLGASTISWWKKV